MITNRIAVIATVIILMGGCDPGDPPTAAEDIAQESINDDFAHIDEEILVGMTALKDCLTEAGFPTHMRPDGGMVTEVGEGQENARRAARDSCLEKVPIPEPRALLEEEVRVLYDLQIEAGDCLEEAGFPTAEMPSKETWVAQYLAADSGADVDYVTPWDKIPTRSAVVEQLCKYPTAQDVYERLTATDK